MLMNRFSYLPSATALLALAFTAGCQSPSADTVLLKKEPGSSVIYRAPGENDIPYATNVVHVPRDARFSLSLETLNPGWLHQESARKESSSPTGSPLRLSDVGLSGKDLWLLVNVRTLSALDAFQAETKQISRASLVKHDLRSFGLIPLTIDEVTPFALEANTDYEVEIRLYEVQGSLHRLASDNRPGLRGVARTAWAATTDTFKAFVGDSALPAGHARADLLIERQLVESGATLHFNTRFAIYRSADTLAPRTVEGDARGGTLINRYQITDPYNRRDTDHYRPRQAGVYADTTSYLERLENFENTEVPTRRDAFVRFRIESMWSPVAKTLAQIEAAPKSAENVSQEQALAAESIATTARETFLRAAEDEKQAAFAAAEALRKSDSNNSARFEETARALSRKTQEVAAARAAMENAQTRAREARQAVETAASRTAQTANAEKTAALADAALENARRVTEAALRDLDAARAALQQTRDAAEAARLKKEEWIQVEAASKARLVEIREELSELTVKAAKKPDDVALRQKLVATEQAAADAQKSAETAAAEWALAQKDQEAKLNEVEDRIRTVAEKRILHAETEQQRQRARIAKDQADAQLLGTEATDPRPAILRARSL